ncbi:MAG: serine/threonine protein kinase [Pseudomonadales bacterium]|nr:serine/threonine protein kinase [Pseudomonadales bacterium]MDP6470725.1 serine/threonine protein kinase [Pseudomonadales bacterium]MDP6828323.1 serine/threonine protein kinase [Pseudomonadales bacterium]MDP6972127.1 serine/threonine protein kinase [Pseudomonadales bacterium]
MTDQPFFNLSPDVILDALEDVGFRPTGSLLALNSFENRVYQVELEDDSFVVTKFYRPGRWSDAQILEEHTFTLELTEAELPCVAPLVRNDISLFPYEGHRFAVYPRQGGRPPDLEIEDNLKVLARTLARIHAYGATADFEHRVTLDYQRFGFDSRTYLIENDWIPVEMSEAYASITEHLLDRITDLWPADPGMRIHGDCHMGNLLWRDETPNFVDFDDCATGPPIQDLWMLLSGSRDERQRQLNVILEAYEPFFHFNGGELRLIEPLRTLRIMYHAAWIARRWEDPAFPVAFPWFGDMRFWSQHVLELREQQAALDEPPLSI